VEGDRAFAQAHDHRVAAGLDALGDGDLALAAEQLDRAHLAQVHPHRVVGALGGFLLLLFGDVAGILVAVGVVVLGDLVGFVLAVFLGRGVLVALDDLHAHFRQRGLDVLDLVGAHLALRQRVVELVVGDVALALGLSDQLLDRRLIEIDQRCVIGGAGGVVGRHKSVLQPVSWSPARSASAAAD